MARSPQTQRMLDAFETFKRDKGADEIRRWRATSAEDKEEHLRRLGDFSIEDLIVFRVIRNTLRDWAAVEEMLLMTAGNLDAMLVRQRVKELVGEADARLATLDQLFATTQAQFEAFLHRWSSSS